MESRLTARPSARLAARRLALAVATLLLVSFVVFAVAELVPGQSGIGRYGDWLARFARGDWGASAALGEPVRPLVLDRLGNSVLLAAYALVLAVPLAVALGVRAAVRRGRLLDASVSAAAVTLLALPEFVVGTILSIVFAVELGWFPVSSRVPDDAAAFFRELTLPAAVLALVLFGAVARVARAGALGALAADYTRTAILKGLPRRRVVTWHVLPNALPPTIAAVGAQTGYLVGGIVVVETLFSYPGIGKLLLDSAVAHDLAPLEACVLATAVVVMAANLVADLAAAALDPRLRRARA